MAVPRAAQPFFFVCFPPLAPPSRALTTLSSPLPSPPLPSVAAHNGDDPAFIRVVNGAFVDEGCNEFLFSGYNTFEVS